MSSGGISALLKRVPVSLKIVCTGNPQLPAAVVNHILTAFRGLSIFTHMSITCRGVKYCPFSPLADLLTRYSNASSTICKLELKSLTSCKLETQTERWLSDSSNVVAYFRENAFPLIFCVVKKPLNFGFSSLSVCPVFLNSRARKIIVRDGFNGFLEYLVSWILDS